jgi:hypothetical protein
LSSPLSLCLILFAFACSSSQQATPAVTIAQTSDVIPIGASPSTRVPVDFLIEVTNPLDQPVTLTSVEFETVGLAGGYELKRVRHSFAEVVPARSKVGVNVRAWAQPLQLSERGDMVTAVLLRGIASFDAAGKILKTTFASHAKQKRR